jgi:hypothetical protein
MGGQRTKKQGVRDKGAASKVVIEKFPPEYMGV